VGAKLVVTAHGLLDPSWNSANCDAVVGCSRWVAKEQQRLTDVSVAVVPNGIDLDRFRPPADGAVTGPPIVAWVGRGSDLRQKQIDRFAAVAPLLRRAGIRVWVADPDGTSKLPPSVADRLTAAAEFWDPVPPDRMPEFYSSVAASGGCVLSTSSFEGLSMAQLEAQACGCPVFGPDVRGVNEAVDPAHGGLLYAPQTPPESLARTITAALSDADGMRRRREACQAYAATRFGFDRMARDYLRIYEQCPRPRIGGWRGALSRARSKSWFNYRGYVRRRWSAGAAQFDAAKALADRGAFDLAYAAAAESVRTCPTLFVRGSRLKHLYAIWRAAAGRAGYHGPAAGALSECNMREF
jgi:glycosyltransferase involved in cell wall biosynthesis